MRRQSEMSKKETYKEAIDRIADTEIPAIIEAILADETLATMDKVHLTGLLDTIAYHFRLLQAGME